MMPHLRDVLPKPLLMRHCLATGAAARAVPAYMVTEVSSLGWKRQLCRPLMAPDEPEQWACRVLVTTTEDTEPAATPAHTLPATS